MDNIVPEDIELIQKRIQAKESGEKTPDLLEFELRTKDGKKVRVIDNSSDITWQGSDAIMHMMQDITERKRMEVELRRSEEMYKALLESGMDAVCITIEQEFAFVNKTFVEMLGYADPSELIGRRSGELVDPRDHERLEEITERRKGGEYQRFIYNLRILKKDGSSIWLDISSIGTEFNGKRASISNSRDITDRIRMEEELRESEKKFQTLLDESRDAVFVLDQEKFLYANQTAAELLGFSDSSELIGRDTNESVAPEDREKVSEMAFRRQTGEDVPNLYEFSLIDKEGSKIPVETHVSLIEYEGKAASLSINRDITERKRMAEVLVESEKRFRGMVMNSNDIIAECDLNDRWTFVSPSVESILGYKPEEMIGKPAVDFMMPQDVESSRRDH
jgi:PAS domain S-box-containing protein